MATNADVNVYLIGGKDRGPTFEEILALARKIGGREPTPEEIARARAKYLAHLAKQHPVTRR